MAKHITAETIAAKIARDYPGKDYDFFSVVEWCAECESHIGEFETFRQFTKVPITIKNKQAVLPCNIWRILNVYLKGCEVMNYTTDNTFVRFSDNTLVNGSPLTQISEEGETIGYINYIGLPIDPETNFPLIAASHQEACYWYCITKLLFPDYMIGKINGQQWEFVNDRYGHYVAKARSSFQNVTRDSLDVLNMIRYNLIPKLRMPKENMK